jgi:lipopolysaccharide/colanic/teichoic acid biosynthesis glycosyltransferase
MWKQRVFDVSSAIFILTLLSPVALLAYPLLHWLIGKPLLFRQERLGRDGKIFTLYKLRSMYKNAEITKDKYRQQNEAPWPMFKISQDPRFLRKKLWLPVINRTITLEIGRFLSRSGLDELPQLYNVLRGEMSLVGPRPLPVAEAMALHQQDLSWYSWRHRVSPGIFSLWALDSQHNKSLTYWKKLEKRGLEMSVSEQIALMLHIAQKQLGQFIKKERL